ncbi:MAG: hypothetical protein AB8B55_13575 [Mariniblastus sp.]
MKNIQGGPSNVRAIAIRLVAILSLCFCCSLAPNGQQQSIQSGQILDVFPESGLPRAKFEPEFTQVYMPSGSVWADGLDEE